MIRFMPDTWRDALLRPLAMAAPNGGVYTEIIAPDTRFLLALILTLPLLYALLRKRMFASSTWLSLMLLALTFISFVPWLLTSGNGRYLMPYVLLIGPLCVGLVYALPSTRSMKLAITGILLTIQGTALMQNTPWKPFDTWAWLHWGDAPYLEIDFNGVSIPSDTLYITLGTNSVSAAAPLFPAESQWINLSLFNGLEIDPPPKAYIPVLERLRAARSLKLFLRANPRAMRPGSSQPDDRAVTVLNDELSRRAMRLQHPTACSFYHSRTMARHTFLTGSESALEVSNLRANEGFWVCPLDYPIAQPPKALQDANAQRAKAVFERMEALCPRFFLYGQTSVNGHPAGYSRSYPGSDTMLIVTRSGELFVKHPRALNPQLIGEVANISKPDFRVNCNSLRGRSGLPWEREI